VRIAYADPPYPGMADVYRDHPDYGGEVDHRALVERLERDFDGWVLHTHVPGLRLLERERILPETGIRICQWIKPFAAFKRNVSVAYAYEPVIIKPARRRPYDGLTTVRDWISSPITLRRGLVGAKPEHVCHWAFEIVGAERGDDLDDLFPGTGAVMRAWCSWRRQAHLSLQA
jgi:hypothetical protein